MKITKVETIPVTLPFSHGGPPTGFGGKDWTNLEYLLVRVETDAGVTGYGEAFGYNAIPATRAAIDAMVAPLVIGRDPLAIGELMDELQLKLHIFGRYGITIFALSGLDIALWDIAGKVAGQPVHRLLGGARCEAIPAYASLLRYGDPDLVSRLTGEACDRGYRYVKLHETTVAPVEAARDAAGHDVPLMVDVNCAWSPHEALEMAEALLPSDLYWLEEPVWPPENVACLAEIRATTGTRIASGENACTSWQFASMFEAGAVDIAQPSVTKVGGLTELRKIFALADTANVRVVPHAPYFGPGFLATLHAVAAGASEKLVERLYVDLGASLYGDAVDPVDGMIPLPRGPGLGIDPDPQILAAHRSS